MTVEEYKTLYDSSGIKLPTKLEEQANDPQAVFDFLFIRNGRFSLRNTVVQPIIINKHMHTMDPKFGLDIYWDFTGTFRKRKPEENIITFNGIHSPNNINELSYDKLVLLEMNKINEESIL